MLQLVLSSDSHVFEPPGLWQTRIDRRFRARAPRIERIDGGDHVVVEADQVLSGIGLISNAGARFEAPETISAQGLRAYKSADLRISHLTSYAGPLRRLRQGNYNGYCNPEIEALYVCNCCSRGLTSSKSITPFQ